MKKLFAIFLILLLPAFALAFEDLDELETRVARKSVNTFYSGEDASSYVWQPQTVIYKDTTTDHEVQLFSQVDVGVMGSQHEYGWQPWSADGKYMSMVINKTTGCFTPSEWSWFTVRSDGAYLRPICESNNRSNGRRAYFNWSPTYPDVAYCIGNNDSGVLGADENAIYREVYSDTNLISTLIVDLIGGDTTTDRYGSMKDTLSSDGLYYWEGVLAETHPWYIAQIEPSGSRELTLTYNQPALDTYWVNTPVGQSHYHDEFFVGNATQSYFIYYIYSTGAWWRMRPWGSDSNAPDHVQDRTSLYDWWNADSQDTDEMPIDANKEVQVINGGAGTFPTHMTEGAYGYWGHGVPDRWGSHFAYTDTNGNEWPSVMTTETHTIVGEWSNGDSGGTQYHVWTGWTDYAGHSVGSPPVNIGISLYNSKTDADHEIVAYLHSATYADFTSPGQSPDGTKIAMNSDWLNSGSGTRNLFVGVTYYPHPPEITACTANAGTVTVTFDWATDGTSRGYTARGWPDELVSDPPPPRETEKFRLWRSADKSTWVPANMVNADIFSMYDFSDGTWAAGDSWTITNVPGDGTWYYAVTSIEWSGLESRCLSNIYSITVSGGSGTGSQDTAYPSSPGDLDNISTSDFHTSFNSSYPELIRYYNIYAEDGSAPTVDQTNRIASISKDVCNGYCIWVDWLGKTDGTTQYVITAVDAQGNESSSSYIPNQVSTHKKAPATADGQYTTEWDDAPQTTINYYSRD